MEAPFASLVAVDDEPANLQFLSRALCIGVLATVASCSFITVYVLWTWSQPHRPAMLALAAGCSLGSLLLLALPVRVIKGRRREVFFVSWSAAIIVIVAVFVGLDGGLEASPLIGLFFLPMIFATLAYPPVPMLIVAVSVLVTFVVMALVEHDDGADTFALTCALAGAAVMCAAISRLHHRQRGELARVSRADPLTDCLNRRGLQERLEAELATAARHDHSTSLIVIDLDDFKAVNDRDGHAAGDALLVWTVQQLVASVRPLDAVGRLGGDEFAVVLPHTARDEAIDVARRIESALAPCTAVSTGAATYPLDGTTVSALHAQADARLYEAKRGTVSGVR